MTRHQLVILTKAKPGQQDEFNRWYDEQHIPDVLRVPGVVGVQRHRVAAVTTYVEGGMPSWESLAIYEIESDDPQAVHDEIRRRANTPDMPLTEALDGSFTTQVMGSPKSGS